MNKLLKISKETLYEFRQTKNMVFCAMMAAFAVVLGYITTIEIGPYIKIGFSGIPNRVIEFMFGPIVGGIFGGTLDILKFFVKPTGPFFIGFTISEILSGIIYGFMLYNRPVKFSRIAIAGLIEKIIVNCLLNTFWLSILYGKGFMILISARIIKNLIMWPIDCIIIFAILTYIAKIMRPNLKL